MKIVGSVANATPVVSPDRAERDIYGVIIDVFWPIQDALVVEEPLCDVGTPSQALIPVLGLFIENRVIGCQCNTCRNP